MRETNAGGELANLCENRAREIVTEGPDQSEPVKGARGQSGRTGRRFALADKVNGKMKMYSCADAINQE